MVNLLQSKICVNNCLDVSKVVTSTQDKKEDKEHGKPPKQFENVESLDEDDSQTQKQLADQLGVSQKAVSNRPREMGKIQKTSRWVSHELDDRQMEKRKKTCDILLAR